MITGILTSQEAYAQAGRALVQSRSSGSEESGITGLYDYLEQQGRQWREHNASQPDHVPDEQLDDYPNVEFLHLCDARIPNGGAFTPADGALWRIRLDDVNAWSLGSFS